jgi:protein TonB
MKSFASSAYDANNINSLGVFTLILWCGCLLIGGLGFALPYERPHSPRPKQEAVKVEMLEVKLTDDPQITPDPTQTPSTESDPLPQAQVPQPVPVAQPSPAIAFALPVKGPLRVVEARHAAYTQATSSALVAAPVAQSLTFGEGEGRQPKPEYPDRARRAGQQGVVTVRLTVAEDGHVTAAEAITPSRWPLLNEAALRVVTRRWRFSPGNLRIYDVPIHFELK